MPVRGMSLECHSLGPRGPYILTHWIGGFSEIARPSCVVGWQGITCVASSGLYGHEATDVAEVVGELVGNIEGEVDGDDEGDERGDEETRA